MRRFIFFRLIQSIVTLLVLSMIIFYLIRMGGDPVLLMLPESATEADYKYMQAKLGLDKPVYEQYVVFMKDALKGDLGKSLRTRRPVLESIEEALPKSIKLVLTSFFIAMLLSIPLGVLAAVKKGTIWDHAARIIAGMGQSMPTFWVGLMLIQLFSVWLRILPSGGMAGWKNYIMPSACLAIFMMAGVIRLLRSSMIEILDQEYIKLARIKGVREPFVVWKHALRNALLSVVSFGGMYIAIMVTGAILVETVFTWPGFGRLAYSAIVGQDFPLIQGIVLTAAAFVMCANLVTDILYGYLDPRIRIK